VSKLNPAVKYVEFLVRIYYFAKKVKERKKKGGEAKNSLMMSFKSKYCTHTLYYPPKQAIRVCLGLRTHPLEVFVLFLL
jgi:hypothetical protein